MGFIGGYKEASLWTKGEGGSVTCNLCCHRCKIAEGKRGICGVRENLGGTLVSLNYGTVIAQSIDPIEKKPLFHFQPGSTSSSVATVGCNLRCLHCQNYDISQMPKGGGKIKGTPTEPESVILRAATIGCKSMAYTYTEPTIFFEYAMDFARLAKEEGLKNVFVTNGFMTPECLDSLDGLLDGANVDLKSFSDDMYKKVCGARLKPVLDSIEHMLKLGIWVEITTLIIPTVNDSEKELREIARWIAKTDKRVPWHISAFHPAYKMMDIPSTPRETLTRAREIGLEEGLRYVYTGNVPGDKGESTYCYDCGKMIIKRYGYNIKSKAIKDSKCTYCSAVIDGVDLDCDIFIPPDFSTGKSTNMGIMNKG
ncbi:MAG: AmmeMemoRadiSam system radical SAM enzyme [Deltaproteobacteria bacterium]|nr:AmmeMemoRadiSam system radical SAM enzyme [Deltaproteobacteria bacterium]